jgi:hypothetical protein
MSSKPEHHHFLPEDLSSLEWGPPQDLDIAYKKPSGSRIDRLAKSRSRLYGYQEATFPIGPNEVGYVLIPDSALALLRGEHGESN